MPVPEQHIMNKQQVITKPNSGIEPQWSINPPAGKDRAVNPEQRTMSTQQMITKPENGDQPQWSINPPLSKAKAAMPVQHIMTPQPTAIEKMVAQNAEAGFGTSHQDLGADARPTDSLLSDGSRAESKNSKGADFAAHMNYKTAQTFKPAEVMLEVARSAKDGTMKLELQLEPAHLGKIQVTLQSDASKQLQVHFTVDQPLSRQALEQHLPQLRLALAQQGLDMGQFSMNMNSQGQQNDGSGESGRSSFGPFAMDSSTSTEVQHESVTRLGINTADDGHISILA
jgi:flagellar hook-length control protein FliK